jgi:hypothetical protein
VVAHIRRLARNSFVVRDPGSPDKSGLPLRREEEFVILPPHRIVPDIFPDFGEVVIISDDVLPVVALPEFASKGQPTAVFYSISIPFCGHGFETMNNIR